MRPSVVYSPLCGNFLASYKHFIRTFVRPFSCSFVLLDICELLDLVARYLHSKVYLHVSCWLALKAGAKAFNKDVFNICFNISASFVEANVGTVCTDHPMLLNVLEIWKNVENVLKQFLIGFIQYRSTFPLFSKKVDHLKAF